MTLRSKIFISMFFPIALLAQNVVTRNDTVPVYHGSNKLALPWASGLNAAQVSHIDLNDDGLLDLFLFEGNYEANYETGDKIFPFLNVGSSGQTKYKFAPEYRWDFPIMEEYALLRDYNCDGKHDIFTRDVRQRVSVYRNDSDTSLEFNLYKRVLSTDTTNLIMQPGYNHYGEIFWGYPDMISVTDIDGDGDLDILSPAINPHFIEYNKNMSIENNHGCDSLEFELKNSCWGQFLEDTGRVTLNVCDVANVADPESKSKTKENYHPNDKSGRHSQDALLALDLNGDGVMDILEGDAGRPYLYKFINGGKKDSSHIVSYSDYFPSTDTVKIVNYPHAFYVDVNNDGKNDLLASPYADRLEDTNSLWYYENIGTASTPVFKLITKSFLQGEMIDVGTQSKPVFFDYNQDSLMDIVIGNYGYFKELGFVWTQSLYQSQLALYKNVGTDTVPAYKLVDRNFANLPSYPLNLAKNKQAYDYHPTFGDLDGDGDEDMIIGDHRGKVHYFENVPVAGEANFQLGTAELLGIDVGFYSTPQLFDLDEDGKLDLIIGEDDGNFNYYRNNTTTTLSFVLEDDSLGNINVKDNWDWTGNSSPFFFKDSLGITKLLSGSKPGFIKYYDSIIVGDTLSTKFRILEKRYQDLWDGIYSTIHGADIDDDGLLDFVMGNQSGGITLYTSLDSVYVPDGVEEEKEEVKVNAVLFPNPAKNEITLKIKCNCIDAFTYEVFDMLGNLVAEFNLGPELTINVRDYKTGMYFIRATNKNRSIVITERFIKAE